MYTITMYNRTDYVTLQASDGKEIPPNDVWMTERMPNVWFTSAQFGPISCLDLEGVHLGGDSSESWGVLVSYQGAKFVGRYEGKAAVNMELNRYGQVSLAGMQFRQLLLPPLLLA